jgi:hypothetical protein
MAGFAMLGLVLPPLPTDKPIFVEIGEHVWWLNQDSRGGVWINGREKSDSDTSAALSVNATPNTAIPTPVASPEIVAPVAAIPPPPAPANVLSGVRLLLKETKTGGFAGKLDRVAENLEKSPEELLAALLNAGLKVPEKAREKPIFVEHAGEIFWLNLNAKEELWVNAKASKFKAVETKKTVSNESDKKAVRRPRPKKK